MSHGGHIVPGDQKSFVLPRQASQWKPWGESWRGKTKLFWSPGTIWPPCDKGEWKHGKSPAIWSRDTGHIGIHEGMDGPTAVL